LVLVFRPQNEAGQVAGALTHVIVVEDTFRQAAEKTRHAVFQHLSARGQKRGARAYDLPDGQQVVFIAAGAPWSKSNGRACGRRAGSKR
jgi:hypothetical protein